MNHRVCRVTLDADKKHDASWPSDSEKTCEKCENLFEAGAPAIESLQSYALAEEMIEDALDDILRQAIPERARQAPGGTGSRSLDPHVIHTSHLKAKINRMIMKAFGMAIPTAIFNSSLTPASPRSTSRSST